MHVAAAEPAVEQGTADSAETAASTVRLSAHVRGRDKEESAFTGREPGIPKEGRISGCRTVRSTARAVTHLDRVGVLGSETEWRAVRVVHLVHVLVQRAVAGVGQRQSVSEIRRTDRKTKMRTGGA